jgi:hypothetical protein
VWLAGTAREIFGDLVSDLATAGVPVKRVDAAAIASAAVSLAGVQDWTRRAIRARRNDQKLEIGKIIGRYQRDAAVWLNVIGATPAARARMGVRPAGPKKLGPVLSIIAAKKGLR